MEENKLSVDFGPEQMPVMRDMLSDFAAELENNPPAEGFVRVAVDVVAKDADGSKTGNYHNEYDLSTRQMALFIQANLLATAVTITDTTNTTRAISANTAVTSPIVVAGTTATAAATLDYKLGAQSSGGSGSVAATVGSFTTTSSTSGNFTVTGTITNTSGGSIAYAEVGIAVTASSNSFLLSHDAFTALNVSNNGTLAVTYTLTFT